MSVNLYTPDEEGNLLLLAEFEGDTPEDPAIVVDMFLDEAENSDDTDDFCVIDLDEGTVVVVHVDSHEVDKPRRSISVYSADDEVEETPKKSPKSASKSDSAEKDDDEEAPKRRGRPPGTKNKPGAKKPGPKSGALNKVKKSAIKSNSASAE